MRDDSAADAARSAILALAFVVLFGSIARADVRHVDPLFIGGTTAIREECQRLVVARPPRWKLRPRSDQPSPATLAACLNLVRSALMQPPVVRETAEPNQPASPDRVLLQLLGTLRAVEQLEPWWHGATNRNQAHS